MPKQTSKFKHLMAETPKPEFQFLEFGKVQAQGEGAYVACSGKLFGVTKSGGGGPVALFDYNKPGRMPSGRHCLNVHAGNVTDMEFCPFNDLLLATSSDDTTVKVTNCDPDPDDMKVDIREAACVLKGHIKPVILCRWNPSANNVISSTSKDQTVKLWNVETQQCVETFEGMSSFAFSMGWNRDGSRLAISTKNKKLRVFDPRAADKDALCIEACEGSKASKVFWADSLNMIGMTCFTKQAARHLKLWDLRKMDAAAIYDDKVDQMTSVLRPYFDYDTGLLFLAGNGDSTVYYKQLFDSKKPFMNIGSFQDQPPQKGGGWAPKRCLDTKKCEIARFMKLTTKGVIPLSFCVPRKTAAQVFQSDLYADTHSGMPANSADEYFKGESSAPVLMSMDPEKRQDMGEQGAFKAKATYAELADENEKLKARIAELEKQLNITKEEEPAAEEEAPAEE